MASMDFTQGSFVFRGMMGENHLLASFPFEQGNVIHSTTLNRGCDHVEETVSTHDYKDLEHYQYDVEVHLRCRILWPH